MRVALSLILSFFVFHIEEAIARGEAAPRALQGLSALHSLPGTSQVIMWLAEG